jgi:hypothetical protein
MYVLLMRRFPPFAIILVAVAAACSSSSGVPTAPIGSRQASAPPSQPSPTPTASISGALIYAVNFGVTPDLSEDLNVYRGNPIGTLNEAPLATIGGFNTGISDPFGVAVDAVGKIYVANSLVDINNDGETAPGSITVFAANPTGTLNDLPLATIIGSNTGLNSPEAVAVDTAGKIYVANGGDAAGGGSITVYAANPSGTLNEPPLATISGSNTGLSNGVSGVAVDASGKIYAANAGSNSITVYAANPSGTLNEVPLGTIAGSNTQLEDPAHIAVDATGQIYVANPGNGVIEGNITVYAANPSGTLNEAPLATITGRQTGLTRPSGVAVDATKKIYVANFGSSESGGEGTPPTFLGSSITVYAPIPPGGGTLNEAPLATIAGSNTGLDGPTGIAVH